MALHPRAIAALTLLALALPAAGDLVQTPNGYPRLPSTTPATAVDAGGHHTCAVLEGGDVDCWGARSLGETIGVPDCCPVDKGQAADRRSGDARAVSAGDSHTCVLLASRNVDCYGSNTYGEAADYSGGDAAAVSANYGFTCVLTTAGNIDCHGSNTYGQANDYSWGSARAITTGTFHKCAVLVGGSVGCGGLNNYGQSWGYSGSVPAVGVSAGSIHTCALLSNGNIDCWGNNEHGQADDYFGGDAVQMDAGGFATCWVKADTTVQCQGWQSLPVAGAVHISVGYAHACALLATGSVECSGGSGYGEAEDHRYVDTDPELPWIPGPLLPCGLTGVSAADLGLPIRVEAVVPCS